MEPIRMPPGHLDRQKKTTEESTCWPFNDQDPLEIIFTEDGNLGHCPHEFFKHHPWGGDGHHGKNGTSKDGFAKADNTTVTFTYCYSSGETYILHVTFRNDCKRPEEHQHQDQAEVEDGRTVAFSNSPQPSPHEGEPA